MATTATNYPPPPLPQPPAPSGSSSSSSMGKRWEQFRHLDEVAYARDVAALDAEQLTALHGRIKRKLITSSMGTAHGVWTAPVTGGFSLVASGVAGRQTNLNVRRLRIIEARLTELNAARYKTRKRDYAIPAGCLGLSSAVAQNCEGFFAEHLATENACQAADVAAGMAQEPIYGALYNRVSSQGSSSQLTSVQLAQGAPVTSVNGASPGKVPSVPSPSLHAQPSPALPPRPASVDPSDAAIPPALPPRPEPMFELEASLAPALPPRPASALGAISSAKITHVDLALVPEPLFSERPDRPTEMPPVNSMSEQASAPLPPLISVVPPEDEVAPPENAPCVVEVEVQVEQVAFPTVSGEKEAIKNHIAAKYPPPGLNTQANEGPIRKGRARATSSPETEMPYFPPPPTYEASIAASPTPYRATFANPILKSPIPTGQGKVNDAVYRMPLPEEYSIPAYNPADYVR